MTRPTLVILAAGKGSRYGGAKQLEPVGPHGETLPEYSLRYAQEAGFGRVVFVIRPELESAFRERLEKKWRGRIELVFTFQSLETFYPRELPPPHRPKPWGTAHALLCAAHAIRGPFATVNADDYYGPEGFQLLGRFLQQECSPTHFGLLGYRLENTLPEEGAVSRALVEVDAQNRVQRITEVPHIRRSDGSIHAFGPDGPQTLDGNSWVSMNLWALHPTLLDWMKERFRAFARAHHQDPEAEWQLPRLIQQWLEIDDHQLTLLPGNERWMGITYPQDLERVRAFLARLER